MVREAKKGKQLIGPVLRPFILKVRMKVKYELNTLKCCRSVFKGIVYSLTVISRFIYFIYFMFNGINLLLKECLKLVSKIMCILRNRKIK